jgi:hypothetical protein
MLVIFLRSVSMVGGIMKAQRFGLFILLISFLYVADGGEGLQVMDVSNPASPIEVGFYNTAGFARGVYVSGSTIYVADSDGGLVILRYLD